jgi:5-formyltetrahydrofolate cyclo-ligase
MHESKARLRRVMRRVRKELAVGARLRAEHSLARTLADYITDRQCRSLGIYAACGGEASLNPLVGMLEHTAVGLCWPRVVDGQLQFHHCRQAELVSGYKGILEPSKDAVQISINALDVLVVPGLAFDRHGGRLGQGGGFYDRLLNNEGTSSEVVGVGFSHQIVPRVPMMDHDSCVGIVMTELGVAKGGFWTRIQS